MSRSHQKLYQEDAEYSPERVSLPDAPSMKPPEAFYEDRMVHDDPVSRGEILFEFSYVTSR